LHYKYRHKEFNVTDNPSLDSYDMKILRGLAQDGCISWRDLAEKIGLSMTPTLRRPLASRRLVLRRPWFHEAELRRFNGDGGL